MKKLLMMSAAAFCAVAGTAANLVPNGDFSAFKDSVAPDFRATPGKVSLFVEDLSWNKCGKLEVTDATTNAQGKVTHTASVYAGYDADSKLCGFPVSMYIVYLKIVCFQKRIKKFLKSSYRKLKLWIRNRDETFFIIINVFN